MSNQREIRPNTRGTNSSNAKKKRRKKRRAAGIGYVFLTVILLVATVGGLYVFKKYSPTKETMELSEYFDYFTENQAAVILNDEYSQEEGDTYAYSIFLNGTPYLELNWVKENLDDGYVYDSSEITLRYATDLEIYTATLGSADYLVDKSKSSLSHNVVVAQDGAVYIACDYLKLLTDFQYTTFENPSRILVETVGHENSITNLKGNTQIRKLNGPKSPVLEECLKGETVNVVRDTGSWSFVISENGVMGYIKNNKLGESQLSVVEASLPERNYKHISIGEDISLAWHQANGQSSIAEVLGSIGPVDVISPTWFYIKDNNGNIASNGSTSYVSYCHEHGVQVWGLVNNLEAEDVDTTYVLNTTSSRDTLVNNLIAQAITYGLDGINVDIEELSGNAKDGYIQFIKELSIKCEKNDIILSVDNYVPSGSSAHYNRPVQANYADYVIIMAYDEHYGGSQEPGSVASLGWVEDGVRNTLDEVPAEQVILGIPFYCRVWETKNDGTVSSSTYGLNNIQKYINNNNLTPEWKDEFGQNYAEFTKDDATIQLWIEDADSIKEKLKVMDKCKLAGAAFWKIGLDNDAAWNVIAEYL